MRVKGGSSIARPTVALRGSKRINDVLQVRDFGWRPRRSPLGSGHHHVHLPAVAARTYEPARATL